MKKPAVFLDRDGVLTVERGYVTKAEDLVIFPQVKECINKMKALGYWTIVITNQSAVARGMLLESELVNLNQILMKEVEADAVYYCPHYEEGSIPSYKIACSCRKPGIGMIQQACRDFEVDCGHSYFVGDRETDIITGKNAGLKTVLLKTGYLNDISAFSIKPEFEYSDLQEFVEQELIGRKFRKPL